MGRWLKSKHISDRDYLVLRDKTDHTVYRWQKHEEAYAIEWQCGITLVNYVHVQVGQLVASREVVGRDLADFAPISSLLSRHAERWPTSLL